MAGRFILPILALLTSAIPAAAQESGGVRLAPGIKGGPVGLARPLPFTRPPLLTAHDLQNGMTSADHQAQDQDMISRLRGDPGFLSGFSFGTPLAAKSPAGARRRWVPLSPPSWSWPRADRHQQPRAAGRDCRQRQCRAAAIRDRVRADCPAAGLDHTDRRIVWWGREQRCHGLR